MRAQPLLFHDVFEVPEWSKLRVRVERRSDAPAEADDIAAPYSPVWFPPAEDGLEQWRQVSFIQAPAAFVQVPIPPPSAAPPPQRQQQRQHPTITPSQWRTDTMTHGRGARAACMHRACDPRDRARRTALSTACTWPHARRMHTRAEKVRAPTPRGATHFASLRRTAMAPAGRFRAGCGGCLPPNPRGCAQSTVWLDTSSMMERTEGWVSTKPPMRAEGVRCKPRHKLLILAHISRIEQQAL